MALTSDDLRRIADLIEGSEKRIGEQITQLTGHTDDEYRNRRLAHLVRFGWTIVGLVVLVLGGFVILMFAAT